MIDETKVPRRGNWGKTEDQDAGFAGMASES